MATTTCDFALEHHECPAHECWGTVRTITRELPDGNRAPVYECEGHRGYFDGGPYRERLAAVAGG